MQTLHGHQTSHAEVTGEDVRALTPGLADKTCRRYRTVHGHQADKAGRGYRTVHGHQTRHAEVTRQYTGTRQGRQRLPDSNAGTGTRQTRHADVTRQYTGTRQSMQRLPERMWALTPGRQDMQRLLERMWAMAPGLADKACRGYHSTRAPDETCRGYRRGRGSCGRLAIQTDIDTDTRQTRHANATR